MYKLTLSLICCLLPTLASAATAEIRDSAPVRHIVVKGDTLWRIADIYLRDPRKWHQVWELNQNSIRNPQRIYPGQVIVLGLSAPQSAPPQPASIPPAQTPAISARITSIYGGTSQADQQTIVIIDKGRRDGVRNGLVLKLYHQETTAGDRDASPASPEVSYGQLLVFRTFDKVSYATVQKASAQVMLLDTAKSSMN